MRITAVSRGQNSVTNSGPFTFIENWTAEADFDHLRILYMVDTDDPTAAIGAAYVAATSRLLNNPVVELDRPSGTWSGNDVDPAMSGEDAQAAADLAWHRALHYADLIRRQGGAPIFLSAVPQAAKCAAPGHEAARLSSVARCHALGARGELTLDLNRILGDGSAPTDYAPRYHIDRLHPNQAAQDRLVGELYPLLVKALG